VFVQWNSSDLSTSRPQKSVGIAIMHYIKLACLFVPLFFTASHLLSRNTLNNQKICNLQQSSLNFHLQWLGVK
jgi:hypothetical protein